MTLIEKEKELLKQALEENWFQVYDMIRESGELIDFSSIANHPMLEEALMRAIAEPNGDLLRLILSRDRGVVTRFPSLKNLDEVKKVEPHFVEAWRHFAFLQTLIGIHNQIEKLVEEDPHRDFCEYLIRAARFPVSVPEYKAIIAASLAKVLHNSSLLGIELTIDSLREYSEVMYQDAVTLLVWYPDYHDRADMLWERRLLSHEVLKRLVPVAKELKFPKESVEWIETHLAAPVPSDPEFPF